MVFNTVGIDFATRPSYRRGMDYPAQRLDLLQLMFDQLRLNDTRLHAVLRFTGSPTVDPDLLAQAVRLTLDAAPILATRFVDRGGRSYWTPIASGRLEDAFAVVADEDALQAGLLELPDGPQVRVLVDASASAIAVTLSHFVADGASFKDYLYLLAECYSGLARDPGYRPEAMDGDRSSDWVTAGHGVGSRFASLLSAAPVSRGTRALPMSGQETAPFLAALETGSVTALRDRCRARGATLNDAVLTACYRVLAAQLGEAGATGIDVPIMVDLRRSHGGDTRARALTNCSSTTATHLAVQPGETFETTLARTCAMTRALKAGDIGLKGALQLDAAYTFGRRIGFRLVRSRLSWPLLCMTNLGSLDPDRLAFGATTPSHAWACGSIKHQPYFQVAVSGYLDTLTLTAGLFGTADDRTRAEAILGAIATELDGFQASRERDPDDARTQSAR
mgnify:FL=1